MHEVRGKDAAHLCCLPAKAQCKTSPQAMQAVQRWHMPTAHLILLLHQLSQLHAQLCHKAAKLLPL